MEEFRVRCLFHPGRWSPFPRLRHLHVVREDMQFSTGWSVCLWRATLHILPEFHGIPWFLLVFWLKTDLCADLSFHADLYVFERPLFKGSRCCSNTGLNSPAQSNWHSVLYLVSTISIQMCMNMYIYIHNIHHLQLAAPYSTPNEISLLTCLHGVTCFSVLSRSLLKQSNPCHPVATKVERCEMEDPQHFHYEIRTLGKKFVKVAKLWQLNWQKWGIWWPICTLRRYFAKVLCWRLLRPHRRFWTQTCHKLGQLCLWQAGLKIGVPKRAIWASNHFELQTYTWYQVKCVKWSVST